MKTLYTTLLIGLAACLISANNSVERSGGGFSLLRCTGVVTPGINGNVQELDCGGCHRPDSLQPYKFQGVQPVYDRLAGNYTYSTGGTIRYEIFATGWHLWQRGNTTILDTLGNEDLKDWGLQLQVTDTNYRPLAAAFSTTVVNPIYSSIDGHTYLNIPEQPLGLAMLPQQYLTANNRNFGLGNIGEASVFIQPIDPAYRGNVLIHSCVSVTNRDSTTEGDFSYCFSDIVFYQIPFALPSQDTNGQQPAESLLYKVLGNQVHILVDEPYQVVTLDGKLLKRGYGASVETLTKGVYVLRISNQSFKVIVR